MHVHHDRRGGGRCQAGAVDVQAVPLQAVACVVEVARRIDGARLEREGPSDPPPPAPGRRCGLVGHGESRAADLVERAGDDVLGLAAGHAEPEQADPADDGERQAQPARPTVQGAEGDEDRRGHHLPDDVLEGQLPRDPPQREAEHADRFPPDRAVGNDHGGQSHQRHREEGVRHATIFARTGRRAQIKGSGRSPGQATDHPAVPVATRVAPVRGYGWKHRRRERR